MFRCRKIKSCNYAWNHIQWVPSLTNCNRHLSQLKIYFQVTMCYTQLAEFNYARILMASQHLTSAGRGSAFVKQSVLLEVHILTSLYNLTFRPVLLVLTYAKRMRFGFSNAEVCCQSAPFVGS